MPGPDSKAGMRPAVPRIDVRAADLHLKAKDGYNLFLAIFGMQE